AVLDRLLDTEAKLGFTEVEILPDPPGHVRLPDEDDEIVDRALSCPRFRGVPEARLMILARRRTTSSASTT
ncbi:hypothetical protein AB8850_35905, partial [Streptomyces griseorubens]